jgi:hypothetical protein
LLRVKAYSWVFSSSGAKRTQFRCPPSTAFDRITVKLQLAKGKKTEIAAFVVRFSV